MIAQALARRGPVADTLDQIFEPIKFETLADVFASYEVDRTRMKEIAGMFDGSRTELVEHFLKGNGSDRGYVNAAHLFRLEPALKALDAAYWTKALQLTDVLESMPQPRRRAWHDLIDKRETPPFDQTNVISTLQDLLVQRHKFFAERVDGIFRALSHEHVTNRPEGFSKRMIIQGALTMETPDVNRTGTINDLRIVIARFMGRDAPRYYGTAQAITHAYRTHLGQWLTLDGGALRLRCYKNGNAHLEVHPEMAWRLNGVLASLYPNAIAEEHRRRPRRHAPKDFVFYTRPLPTPVVELLADGHFGEGGALWSFRLGYDASQKAAYAEACDVLTTLGATRQGATFVFDYNAENVIKEVTASGVIPDKRSHQYYPTPAALAQYVVDAAEIQPEHTVLEPSAGTGTLAGLLPQRTVCIEISKLYAQVLIAKRHAHVIHQDFLTWKPGRRFDRIVMNPPFDRGQWVRHLEHASDLCAQHGRIVAVLPSGARRTDVLPGWSCTWSDPIPFFGTSIEVVVLVADRN